MSKLSKFLVILIFSSCSGQAFAYGDDYKCKIERLSLASGNEGNSYDAHKELFIGKEFTVDRKSGLMVGALKNSYVTAPLVIDYGSSENSYKVVTTMTREQGAGAGSNIYALTVEEFVSGASKPFVFLQNSKVFFGNCYHY